MNASRWERVQTLFHLAADLPEAERRDYVCGECTDDPSVADEVLAMLDEDSRADSLLDRDVSHLAKAMLDSAVVTTWPSRLNVLSTPAMRTTGAVAGAVMRRPARSGHAARAPPTD